jgi:uncharacterized protein (TIGR03437 family)
MLHMTLRILTLALFGASVGFSQATLNVIPSREIGQPQLFPLDSTFPNLNPNLVEGRELFAPQSVALDLSVTPPILYVSDTNNNRVLAWNNAASFANGKPADLVVGQRDFFNTRASGPSTAFSAGLSAPTGLAVFGGDLYVADSGNNRVLRFRKPFSAPSGQLIPDLVIGQTSLSKNGANSPSGLVNTNGIALVSGNQLFQASIAFDTPGNLWLTDPGNRRVLMYAAADVAKSNNFGLTAQLELGQLDFITLQPNLDNTNAQNIRANQFAVPAGLAFDVTGRLYVTDAENQVNRVLVFTPPFSSGQTAARIMGILTALPQGTPTPDPRTQLTQALQIRMSSPSAVFFLPGNQGMGVMDTGLNRILIFDPFESWPPLTTATSPSAKAVIGQGGVFVNADGTSAILANNGNPRSSASTLSHPAGAVFGNNELYVADSANNRVIVLPLQTGTFGSATRLLGQDRFDSNSINLIEGREFQFVGGSVGVDAGLAIDSTGDVPHLYVADPYNNRVLGFNDLRALKPGLRADIVIGQPDMATALCDPDGHGASPTASSLCRPVGLLVDSAGNLYVADSGNGRVLRFPTPFAQQGQQQADLVLGKRDFSDTFSDPSNRTLAVPYGLAFSGTNGLLVSDQAQNRVLYFRFTGNATFTAPADDGLAAAKVFGQPDFTTIAKGNSDTAMNNPHHLSADSEGRPYVADTGNNRVLVFNDANNSNTPNAGAHAALQIPSLNSVEGLFVSQTTGEAWITSTNAGTVLKFPKFDTLQFNIAATASVTGASFSLAVVQDQFGNLIVADGTNRVAFYYPTLNAQNAANGMPNRALAPGTIGSIFATTGGNFGNTTAANSAIPLPKALVDVQVLVNGVPAPLYFVGPTQINFVVPMNTSTGGPAEVQVLKVSTGQLLAISSAVQMNTVSPAIFETSQTGTDRQAAVINGDGKTVNSPTTPAKRGDVISIYATGQGALDGAPADGDIPQNGLVNTPYTPKVLIGDFTDNIALQPGDPPDRSFVKFSGLSPSFAGVWQVNVQIPFGVAPGKQILLISVNSVASDDVTVTGYRTVIYVQ